MNELGRHPTGPTGDAYAAPGTPAPTPAARESRRVRAVTGTLARTGLIAVAAMMLNGEYYKYGPSLVLQLPLLGLYLGYVVALEDLVRRYRWTARELFLAGALFGAFMEAFMTRSFYADPPRVLGVNWLTVAIQLLYWGALATVLPFHLGARILPRRSEQPFLGALGWSGLGIAFAALIGVWTMSLPPLRAVGVIPAAALVIGLAVTLVVTTRRPERHAAVPRRSRLLDVAVASYLVAEIVIGTVQQMLVVVWILTGFVLGVITLVYVFRKCGLVV